MDAGCCAIIFYHAVSISDVRFKSGKKHLRHTCPEKWQLKKPVWLCGEGIFEVRNLMGMIRMIKASSVDCKLSGEE
jgi:hypothetical protein